MIKNHPLKNGNKRIAIASLLYFLLENKRYLKTSQRSLYDFAVRVAESPAKEKKKVVKKTERFIREHLIKAPFPLREEIK